MGTVLLAHFTSPWPLGGPNVHGDDSFDSLHRPVSPPVGQQGGSKEPSQWPTVSPPVAQQGGSKEPSPWTRPRGPPVAQGGPKEPSPWTTVPVDQIFTSV